MVKYDELGSTFLEVYLDGTSSYEALETRKGSEKLYLLTSPTERHAGEYPWPYHTACSVTTQ